MTTHASTHGPFLPRSTHTVHGSMHLRRSAPLTRPLTPLTALTTHGVPPFIGGPCEVTVRWSVRDGRRRALWIRRKGTCTGSEGGSTATPTQGISAGPATSPLVQDIAQDVCPVGIPVTDRASTCSQGCVVSARTLSQKHPEALR